MHRDARSRRLSRCASLLAPRGVRLGLTVSTARSAVIEIFDRQRRVRGFDLAGLRQNALAIEHAAGIGGRDVCVTLVSDARIRRLNRDYRGKDRPTDVLSFAQTEGEDGATNPSAVLGDVLISLETAERQLDVRGFTLLEEVTHLLIHGVLHLLGHDHERDDEAARMEAEEQRLWAAVRGAA